MTATNVDFVVKDPPTTTAASKNTTSDKSVGDVLTDGILQDCVNDSCGKEDDDKEVIDNDDIKAVIDNRNGPTVAEAEEKQQQAKKYQETGNKLFKLLDYNKAIEMYHKAVELAKQADEINEKTTAGSPSCWSSITHLLYSNLSLCYFNKKEYEKAFQEAEKCVQTKPDFLKGYCRGCDALVMQGQLVYIGINIFIHTTLILKFHSEFLH